MQVLKDELRHKILLEAQHLFLQRGYDRTSLQMIADKVNISKSNLYHYFKNKEELFYELTDGAADGLKKLILRLKDKRFDLHTGQREYQMLLTEEVISLLLAEKYGLLLIMEQAHGTRYESLRESMIDMLAAKTMPLLADEDNCLLLAQIMARNLLDGTVQVLKTRIRPREVRTGLNRLVEYHTKGINALLK
ncbi:MAG TPA: TetR/AcrR family transcriptional regulator [Candidatus Agathobaculum intestinipullorum]|nr:TetR/AcrR family transcriptional regulator [uncultured Agathobaculum sp.]HJA49709.1 TetR/AcrR family transcriptional regulator [Candidatus Agathobaculum intestinipullorum]